MNCILNVSFLVFLLKSGVDDDEIRVPCAQPLPEQHGARCILAVDVGLEEVDEEGVGQGLANPSALANLARTPEECGLPGREVKSEESPDDFPHQGSISG